MYKYLTPLLEKVPNKNQRKLPTNSGKFRRVCSEVARQFVGKPGRAWQNLTTKVKSVAIRQGELVTASLVSNLECQVGQLEHNRDHILGDNKILEVTCQEVSETLRKIKTKPDKTEADLAKIKVENESLYNVIETISPERKCVHLCTTLPFSFVGHHRIEQPNKTCLAANTHKQVLIYDWPPS